MRKVILTKVYRGKQQTKFGEKDKIGVKFEEFKDRWLTSFKVMGTENWKEGDEVTLVVTKNGDWLNFHPPTLAEIAMSRIDELKKRVEALEALSGNSSKEENKESQTVQSDDIPF